MNVCPGGSVIKSETWFMRILEDMGAPLYRYLYSQLVDRQWAEDIYQDVFLALLETKTEFTDDDHVRFWLFRVASNKVNQFFRKSSTRREVSVDVDASPMFAGLFSNDESKLEFDADHYIWEYVEELPRVQRECIYFKYVEGYSTSDIAKITRSRAATVRTRLLRARIALRQAIERRDHGF